MDWVAFGSGLVVHVISLKRMSLAYLNSSLLMPSGSDSSFYLFPALGKVLLTDYSVCCGYYSCMVF